MLPKFTNNTGASPVQETLFWTAVIQNNVFRCRGKEAAFSVFPKDLSPSEISRSEHACAN
jgi:hypothetical protein